MKMYRIAVANIIVVCMSLFIFDVVVVFLSNSPFFFLPILLRFVYRAWAVYVSFQTLFHLFFKIINFLIRFRFRSHRWMVDAGTILWTLFFAFFTCCSSQIIIIINILTSNVWWLYYFVFIVIYWATPLDTSLPLHTSLCYTCTLPYSLTDDLRKEIELV